MDGHLLRYNQDVTYAFIDLETFNLCLHFFHNRPWQVGILKVKGERVLDARDIRVVWPDAPHLAIGKEAAVITRFDPILHKQLAINPEPAFAKFWPILEEVDYIVMHNGLKFDLYLLKCYAEMMGKPWKWMMPKIIDTKSVAQGIKMNIPFKPKDGTFLEYQYRMANIHAHGIKTRLALLGKEYGIPHDYERLHDAIVDLELNLKVWNKMKYQLDL
jgi:hypothetical protein